MDFYDKFICIFTPFLAIVIVCLIAKFAKREIYKTLKNARIIIRNRLLESTHTLQADEFLSLICSNDARSKHLLKELAKLLDIPVTAFPFEGLLGSELSVKISDISSSIQKGFREEEMMMPFAYDLIAMLEKTGDQHAWDKCWEETDGLPIGEEALIDFIMAMTLEQFVKFFTPLTKWPRQ